MQDLTVEQLDRSRRRMLLGFLDGYAAWQIPQVVHGLHPGALPLSFGIAMKVMALFGVIGFVYYGLQLLRISHRAKTDPAVGAALNDERVRLSGLRATAFAFMAVLVYMGVVCLLALVLRLQAVVPLMQLGIVIAWCSLIGAFLWQERREDREAAA